MQATDILMSEHRVIERVIASLETAAARLERGEDVRPGFFLDAADFVKGFADGCHHKKEEGVLFPTLVANGMPQRGGPIAVMLAEHEQGRAYIRGLREAASRLEALGPSAGQSDALTAARQAVIANAQGYAHLLREHIAKEDGVLFPMAAQVIPLAKQGAVVEEFERVEHEETGEGVHEKYLALAGKLEDEVRILSIP
jgi:hemerythrin-like domain-containing protein